MNNAFVYLGAIPTDFQIKSTGVKFRDDEIASTTSTLLKAQKCFSVEVLKVGLWDGYRLKIEDCNVKKESGKFVLDGAFVSISHSGNLVAVAISKKSVGVDVECITDKTKVIKRALSASEECAIEAISDIEERKRAFISLWTKKESLFKSSSQAVFSPSKTEVADKFVKTFAVNSGNAIFSVAMATEFLPTIKFVDKVGEKYVVSRLNCEQID